MYLCVQYASIKFIDALIGKLAAGQSAKRLLWTHLLENSSQIELMNSFVVVFFNQDFDHYTVKWIQHLSFVHWMRIVSIYSGHS